MSFLSRFARCSAVVEGGMGVERMWMDMMVIGTVVRNKDRSRSRVLDLIKRRAELWRAGAGACGGDNAFFRRRR